VPVWTVEYEFIHGPNTEGLTRNDCAKRSMGTPGLLPRLAIQRGDLRALDRLHRLHSQPQFSHTGKFWFTSAMADAAACGSLEALQWLNEHTSAECSASAITDAAANGHTDVVRWLLNYRPDCLDLSPVMLFYRPSPLKKAMELAAINGHVEILKMLSQITDERCPGEAMDRAAANGHLQVVEFLHTHKHEKWSTAAADGAAANGHLDVLRWLLKMRSGGFTDDAAYGAVVHGHLDVLEFFEAEYFLSGNESLAAQVGKLQRGLGKAVPRAIIQGSVRILTLLHRLVPDAFPWFAMTQAVSAGYLDVVEFLYGTSRSQEDIDEALKTAKRLHADEIIQLLSSTKPMPASDPESNNIR
jgi:hypothetical protein